MGLRRINPNDETSYMYTNTAIPDEILVILLRSNTAFSVQLKTESDAVKKWCRNLQKSPQEYMALLHKAVETCSVTYTEDKQTDKNEDVFEIQEDCLVWKQYFPDKNVYGKRGKFTLDKKSYEEAVKEVLNGTIGDLDAKSGCIQKLTDGLDQKSKELQRAKDLTAKSVLEKEVFEKEVYGKCVSIINSKKLKIRQLTSGQPSSSRDQPDAVRKILTSTLSTSQSSKLSKSNNPDSDGYSSDTDVDDPAVDDEIDTDEENSRRAETRKRKTYEKSKAKPARQVIDSQDDLFNNSLEAELYSTDMLSKKQKVTKESSDESGKKGPGKKGRKETSNGKTKSEDIGSGSHSSSHCARSESQLSIFDELF